MMPSSQTENRSILPAILGTLHRHVVNARAITELNRLSDRELQDIGLSRSEIVTAVSGRLVD